MKIRIACMVIILALLPCFGFSAETLPKGVKVGDTVGIRFVDSEGYSTVKILQYDLKTGWIRCKRKNDTIWASIDKIIAIKKMD